MAKRGVKVVDKWKKKKWYTVVAPDMFDKREIGEVVASDDKYLPNRVIRKSLGEINPVGLSQMGIFTTLKFRIKDVKGTTAYTDFIGHEMAQSYIKTLARRGRTLIHHVIDGKTKDGKEVRLKAVAVTGSRVSQNTKKNLRELLDKTSKQLMSEMNFNELVHDIVYGRFSAKLFNQLKQITKMKRVEIRKSEVKEVLA